MPREGFRNGFKRGVKAALAYRDQNPSDEVLKLVEALECVEAHDFGRADLFATMENTVKVALSQWRKARGE